MLPKGRRLVGRTVARRRFLFVALAVLSFVLWHNLPLLHKNGNRADRRTPKYDVDDVPHFVHRASFRVDPDLEYEERVSQALRNIERAVIHENGGEYVARDRIWQVMLGKNRERSEDSLAFEDENEGWEYSLVTTDTANAFIDSVFLTVPDLKDIYMAYPLDILRADLLRYLLLWYHGGYYADTDVFPKRSIKDCPSLEPLFTPPPHHKPNISLVIGIELDEPKASSQLMRHWRWTRRYGFIQYTLYAPRRFSPLLRETIVRALSHTRQHIQQYLLPWGPRYNEHAILEISGPGMFTDTVLDTLSQTLPPTNKLVEQSVGADLGVGDLMTHRSGLTQRRVTWAPFFGIKEPLCVDASEATDAMGGLCVLPVNAWGNGQRHSGSENFGSQHACVNHRFKGSWKPWKKSWKEYFFG
ncbi:hypothetical protein P170DRAFT_450651 [Aspergillus steynii IBT 23096]|uniref:Uncharacterized protein n=1 Tax=Aspergillus steynii IBT 23096 TaxID=1392250 RepID=A0A2I2FVB8_9EURO|nr:uncharacterized protein P170DRAFT_450651 [Aspergillus steynii IBT 23096]PLB44589.1 hypothetical protein P170DRAFT_450651 [Aspergillus steynii IBT 23096]